MKIFIINLEHQKEKRQFMQEQLDRLGLEAEFIAAVNGKSMSADQLREAVYDYENCCLTPGEVGCASSHIGIYKIMVDQNIENAIILEDDAILSEKLSTSFNEITKSLPSEASCCLLTEPEVYNKKIYSPTSHGSIHQMLRGYGTYGYVINLSAAKNLLSKASPIKSEADRWEFFSRLGLLKTYCVIPALVLNGDASGDHSNLMQDRKPLIQKRLDYYKKLIDHEMTLSLKIKWTLWRLLKRPFIDKVKM